MLDLDSLKSLLDGPKHTNNWNSSQNKNQMK